MTTAAPAPPPPLLLRVPVLAHAIRSPAWNCVVVTVALILGLGLDTVVPREWQPVLGLCAWLILLALLVGATPLERAQTGVVIVVATFFEVVGSIIWGVYVYRFDNLPMFVPPGHGMVYLFGLRLSQTAWGARNRALLVRAAITGALGWALLGVTVLERRDVAGAIGAVVLACFLVRGRSAHVYAGVFFYVAALELYGTAIGTWYWLPEVPGLGVPNGNPPSGIAGGYVFFDIAAITLAPLLLALWRRHGPGGGVPAPVAVVSAAVDAPVVRQEAESPGVGQRGG